MQIHICILLIGFCKVFTTIDYLLHCDGHDVGVGVVNGG